MKAWYQKVAAMKKQGLEADDVLAANLENSMQQALRLMQQIHAAEASDDDEEDEDEEEADEDEDDEEEPEAKASTQDDEEEDESD